MLSLDSVKDFRASLVLSLVISVMAFVSPWLLRDVGFTASLKVSVLCAAVWGAVVLFTLIRFRNRALWLLLGAPPALYWPFVFVWLAWNCAHDLKGFCG
jgi:hypothetical protein